ncbi:MAG: DUF1700 domain-containing protein [Oscillospiraceae bacterium]|jgi:uncharacterized membrane protein|nr:DUF1700 domain-containing protein [Oscillospiraceae bacterium]
MSKYEFMFRLEKAISSLSEAEKADILNDYEEHFRVGLEKGKTEAEICESLGNPEDLAASYFDEQQGKNAPNVPPYQQASYTPYNNAGSNKSSSAGGRALVILGAIALLIFVLIPVASTLIGVLVGFAGAAIGLCVGGIALIVSCFWVAENILLLLASLLIGIALVALSILIVIGLVYAVKGTVWLCKKLVVWYSGLLKTI